MATLISSATGNFTAAGTWKTASTAGEVDSNASTVVISTSNIDSASFTPAATAVDAIGIKIADLTGNGVVGTLSVILRNSTTSTDVATVTINMSDLADIKNGTTSSDYIGTRGWNVFSFASHTPNGTDSYIIRVVRSSSTGTLRLLSSSATTTTFSRFLRTTTTAAPAAGDKLIVAGEFTGAGSSTTYTVTLDNTATTSFGPTVSGGPPESMTINNHGVLQLGSAASTNYYLKLKGILAVYTGGQLLLDNATATTGSITGATDTGAIGRVHFATNTSPIKILSPSHGLATGDWIQIYGTVNNTAADGTWKVTYVDQHNFTLDGSTGNADYGYENMLSGVWSEPIRITSASHGLSTGDTVSITGVTGNTAANGCYVIDVVDSDNFLLRCSGGNGAYVSGGTWVKRTYLPSTSTFVLEFDSAASGDGALDMYDGAYVSIYGYPVTTVKTTLQLATDASNDTTSINALVDTNGTAVTWKEGQKFNTGWTGTVNINGSNYTISSVPSTTSMVLTATAGNNSGVVFYRTGYRTLKVESTSGWAANDTVLVCSSGETRSSNIKTISTVDSATQVTTTADFTTYHSAIRDGVVDYAATVYHMTRNIKIRGISSTLTGSVRCVPNVSNTTGFSKVAIRYVEFTNLRASGRASIDFNSGTTRQVGCGQYMEACSVVNSYASTSNTFNVSKYYTGTTKCSISPIIKDCCFFVSTTQSNALLAHTHSPSTATVGVWMLDGNLFVNDGANGAAIVQLVSNAIIVKDNEIIGGGNGGVGATTMSVTTTASLSKVNLFPYYGNIHRASAGLCLSLTDASGLLGVGPSKPNKTMRMISINGRFLITGGGQDIVVDCVYTYGNYGMYASSNTTYRNCKFMPGPYALPGGRVYAVGVTGGSDSVFFDNCDFGTSTNQFDSLFATNSTFSGTFYFLNCNMYYSQIAYSSGFEQSTNSSNRFCKKSGMINIVNQNRIPLNNTYYRVSEINNYPTIFTLDSTTYRTNPPSLKVLPTFMDTTRTQTPKIYIPVVSGTAITPSMYVRKSANTDSGGITYLHAEPRLILLQNRTLGVYKDTVLYETATGSPSGQWIEMSGTSPVFSGDGYAYLIVDCGGYSVSPNSGWIHLADFRCFRTGNTTSMKYSDEDGISISPNVFIQMTDMTGGFDD